MRIKDLLSREPFYDIFFQTIHAYLQQRFNCEGGFSFVKNSEKTLSTWYVNEKLNVIFPAIVQTTSLSLIRNEFSVFLGKSKLRRFIQWCYVRLATEGGLARWFSDKVFYLFPAHILGETAVILGGRQKLRILDRVKGTCTVLIKHGFDTSICKGDIEVRKRYPQLPVPELICEGAWGYEEKFILGTPINRLSWNHDEVVHQYLSQISEINLQTVSLLGYLSEIRTELEGVLSSTPLLMSERKRVLGCFDDCRERVMQYNAQEIELGLSHGDFQSANIIFSNERYWIIDWENLGHRSKWYDYFTYSYDLRFPDKFFSYSDEWQKQPVSLYVILMENILVLSKQNSNPYYVKLDSEWSRFFYGLSNMLSRAKV